MRARWERYFSTFYEVSKAVSSTLELHEVLNLIAKCVVDAMDVKACSIRLLNEKGERLEISAVCNLSEEYLRKGPVELEKSLLDQEVMSKCEPICVFDAAKDPRVQYPEEARREGICSMLCAPLTVKGRVIGVLRVYTSRPRRFHEDEVRFLAALAEQGAIAIENARLYERLRKEYEELMKDVWKWYDWGVRPPK